MEKTPKREVRDSMNPLQPFRCSSVQYGGIAHVIAFHFQGNTC